MNLIVCKTFTFDASHQLPDEEKYGKCRSLHGHTYHLEIAVIGRRLFNSNQHKLDWVMDFKELKEIVQSLIINYLDHNHINSLVELSTAENIVADFIVPKLKDKLQEKNVTLYSVKLWETPTSYCEWRSDLQ